MQLLFVICGDENGTNGHHLAVVSVDSTPIGVLVVLAMPVKNCQKCQAMQLDIHSTVGAYTDYE